MPQWRAALDAVQRRHPLLSARIDGSDPTAPMFVRSAGRRIPLRIVPASDNLRWRAELADELRRPFDPGQAPLMRAVVVLGHQQTILMLVAHHSIADGISLMFVIRDILRVLVGERLEALPVTPAQETLLEDVTIQPLEFTRGALPAASVRQAPAIFRSKDTPNVALDRVRFSAGFTALLRLRAREQATTVHGALCAALVLAWRKTYPTRADAPVRVASPIDIRDYLGVSDACGNFLASGIVAFEPDVAAQFWDLARIAKARLLPAERLSQIVTVSEDLSRIVESGLDPQAAADFYAQTVPCDIVVTNIGPVPLAATYKHLRLDAVWGPIALPHLHRSTVIGATCVNGSLCLTQTSLEPFSALLQTAEELLMSAAR